MSNFLNFSFGRLTKKNKTRYFTNEPLSSELFSADQMEAFGKVLAAGHLPSEKKLEDVLLDRLDDNSEKLLEVRNKLTQTLKAENAITPAGEWLLDNFYLIEEQILLAKKHLPKGYSEGLPQLEEETFGGVPRVYDMALEFISHSDGRLDIDTLNRLLQSYQTVTTLKLGELWAIPIMLRLAIIENLRRIALQIAIERDQRDLSDYWAKKLIDTAENERQKLIIVMADMTRSNPPLERAFISELSRQLRGHGSSLLQVLTWFEERLGESGHTISEMVQADNQKQASDQLTISNCINSLRSLNNIEWRDFVEQNSAVEKILRKDALYGALDFTTRDEYRHVIEHIAKHSKLSETQITEAVVEETKKHEQLPDRFYKAHVGYYLVDEGIKQTEKLAQARLPISEHISKRILQGALAMYLWPVLLITALLAFAVITHVRHLQHHKYIAAVIGVVTVITASQLAVAIMNFFYSIIVKPTLLPKMDYSNGIPEDKKTVVAIPSLLLGLDEIETLVEAIEIRFLANKVKNVFYVLLTDYRDAKREILEDDDDLLNAAKGKIEALNLKYAGNGNDIFFLFNRPRIWNQTEKVWMGYERKRGKLAALNAFLLNRDKTPFNAIVGNTDMLVNTRYVLTLDSDTQLPRDAVTKIVATIAHPLNQAVFDEKKKVVTRGYGILQPRVSVSLPRVDSSEYARLNGNEPGIDPYTRATSDVYQDLFKEGSFIGKGIYDVAIFEKALNGRFPDNRILSHDLLEGCYVRSGLISDVQLYEKYPPRYNSDLKRRHRWIRGDWQIAAWFLPWVPDAQKHWHANPLSGLSKWKIFDNIRRSLFPIAATALILLGWVWLPLAGWWTLIVSGMIVLPPIVSNIWNVAKKPKDTVFSHHLLLAGRAAGNSAISNLFTLICLPYEAYINLDAILRTAWRMTISKKHLLEWNPSGITDKMGVNTLGYYYLSMCAEPLLAIAAVIYLSYKAPQSMIVAGPILLLWLVAPAITWWVSRAEPVKAAELTPAQKIFFQKSARRIWKFFDEEVGPRDNWLPPDNIQEEPRYAIAHRTSPTNIGLSLLGNLSAFDFGYISASRLLERCTNTFATMERMERFKGHFYNWYDTQTLQPLTPCYISTVDSGNMVGHILTLKQGLIDLPARKIIEDNFFENIRTTIRLMAETGDKKHFDITKKFKVELESAIKKYPENLFELVQVVKQIKSGYDKIYPEFIASDKSEIHYWKIDLQKQIDGAWSELLYLMPAIENAEKLKVYREIVECYAVPTMYDLQAMHEQILSRTPKDQTEGDSFVQQIQKGLENIFERYKTISHLEAQCEDFSNVDWEFLYNKNRRLLSIGYNANEHRLDNSYYDLLASEARLAVFVAVAQGKIPQDSWFALGRHLLNVDNNPVLLSWSGSMFEYLMPLLVMPDYDNTLLAQTDKASVQRQINYGKQANVPWGISECGYNMIDAAQNYQYRAFGVPGLGLKRGLGEDLVVAPYASVLAAMVAPEKAVQNLQQITQLGAGGSYGFYEAIDYTASRLSRNQSYAVIRSYMAHHQGMSLLSLASVLLGQRMQKRFEAEPIFNSTLLLLEERIPKTTSFYVHTSDIADTHAVTTETEIRIIHTPDTPVPEVQLLSNGGYQVMLTAAGGGYSRWRGQALTRWREDSTSDNWGNFCYIRNLETGEYWSTAYQPLLKKGSNFEVAFSQGRADYRDTIDGIEMHSEIVVSPEDDIEMRRVHLTNRGSRTKYLDVTTFAEVVLAPPEADLAHPAFSKLFVETSLVEGANAIICKRRPRTSHDAPPVMFHMVKVPGKPVKEVSYETDRLKFIGRTRTTRKPQAMEVKGPLSNSMGAVLDPIVSIRNKILIEEDETVVIDIVMGAGETEDACLNLIHKYHDKAQNDRVFDLAWTHSQVVLRQINASPAEAQLYTRLASSILFLNPAMRPDATVLSRNNKGQSGLWPYSISGDVPIVFARVEDSGNVEFVKQLIQAHSYWRLKGLIVDLIICNESHGGYRQELQDKIMEMVTSHTFEKKGGIYVRSADQISMDDKILFQTVARINISTSDGNLEDFIERKPAFKQSIPYIGKGNVIIPLTSLSEEMPALTFNNGYGGFTQNGKEYVIRSDNKNKTPMPWCNVLANENFGTVISENGQCYSWAENAHEFRLTPWLNDPVSDLSGEAFYIRDEESGYYWSPLTALTEKGVYTVKHGFGYSVFTHIEDGIQSEMWIYVDTDAPVKFNLLKLKNISGRSRNLTVTGYTEWVLGDLREKHSMFINTELDMETAALITGNNYNTEFAERIAFFDTDESEKTFTISRTEFIGRNKTLRNPDALLRARLSSRKVTGGDPCTALQVKVALNAGKTYDVVFRLGAAKNKYEAKRLIQTFRGKDKAHEILEKVKQHWANITGAVDVVTPDTALNFMANGWLAYQVIASRIWARTGFYQSSGAFGFRDQLQDSLAVMHINPQLARNQILLCASKQFPEGDVLHWWHPPVGRGIRSKCSDDFLWLPYATARYIKATGDIEILKQEIHFIEGRLLDSYEESNYDLPAVSIQTATLYEHCIRAIRHGLRYGQHGLPLMGTGDWNDGMDEVGRGGKGESIWLAFFLYDVLKQFALIAAKQKDDEFTMLCKAEMDKIKRSVNESGWDGEWFKRAYFDDGSPLGSKVNEECKIDSLAQSWSVLSGLADKEKSLVALNSAYKLLVDKEYGLIKLLAPPFNKSSLEPGYIKGYLPGVRENGGQYTHAAIWLIMAFIQIDDNDKAYDLFSLVNPVNKGRDNDSIKTYRAEPYVTAGDVYSQFNAGQAGWTWYSGSAGWMYCLIIEEILGLKLVDGKLVIEPHVPSHWNEYHVKYKHGHTVYNINFKRLGSNQISIKLNGKEIYEKAIELIEAEAEQTVDINY